MRENEFPILEFDEDRSGMLEPEFFAKKKFDTDKMIITFFPEVMEKLKREGKIEPERTIPGESSVDIFRFTEEKDILITPGQVGCPACAGNLDLFQAMGVRKVMFCGGGGVLDSTIEVGQLLLAEGAIRDEGFSYHYLEPARIVYTDRALTDRIAAWLDQNSVSYLRGLTWTTDALFRETRSRIARRRGEGAKIVEMEQAGCMAVAQRRGFDYGALIYGGDDCSSEEWSDRSWRSRGGIRYDMVSLCRRLLREVF